MRKTLHVAVEDRIRMLAQIRASELNKTVSDYVSSLVETDAEAAGLRSYLERQNREEACGE